ncbi:MAG: phage protease [Terriglobia bacterium]
MKNETFNFVSQLSAVPAEGLARIPILVTGNWVKSGREVSFTRNELSQAVENFQKLANHDLNVDYDHACEDLERAAGEPTPSAGRILALDEPEEFKSDVRSPKSEDAGSRTSDSGPRFILYGRYEPTDRARKLIKSREYRYVSAAFAKDYPDRKTGESQGLTLTSVALTNQPFLDELPEIWLSISGIRDQGLGVREPKSLIPNPQPLDLSRLSAEQGGNMPKLTLKCSADGTHEAYDGDSKVGEIENDHLYDYATKHVGKEGASVAGNLSARGAGFPSLNASGQDAYAAFASEVGAEGRSTEEIRGLVALALHPLKAEITLLSEAIGADGKLDNSRLDALDDSGKISRSAWRRAKDAEQRVQSAFHRGQITPAMMATGAPLRLALADGAAFKALVEDRPALVKTNSVLGIGGSGSETGESPRQLFSRLVEEKKQQLMQTDVRLGELEAHRKAGALVAKENPDLLKNYRADAKSA